jgi:23S rRNA (uracil1939-C5)-methyltransferase
VNNRQGEFHPEELEVEDLAFDGKAVAHRDGKVIFLDAGLPGERVIAQVVQSKKTFDLASVKQIIRQSDERVPANCVHVSECGGCSWQDLNYPKQLFYKRKQVVDCLERIGGLESVTVAEAVGSPELFHYRNKMEFSFAAGDGGSFTVGLHRRGRFDEIFDLDKCWLAGETTNRLVDWFRRFVRDHRMTVYDVMTFTGYARFLQIREAKNTGQVMVNFVTNLGAIENRLQLIDELRREFPDVVTLVHNQTGKKANIAIGESEEILFGPGYVEERLFESVFRIRANSFFQTNTHQTETLYGTAFDMLELTGNERLLDLYCGIGSIGILAASRVREVVGVELVADAVKAARENADINNVRNISFIEGDARDVLATLTGQQAEGAQFDVIVVDPPRAGMHPKALKRILELAPRKLCYISCNPATFARDAADMVRAGYRLPEVRPIDMFPHTKHIEVVGVFDRP